MQGVRYHSLSRTPQQETSAGPQQDPSMISALPASAVCRERVEGVRHHPSYRELVRHAVHVLNAKDNVTALLVRLRQDV